MYLDNDLIKIPFTHFKGSNGFRGIDISPDGKYFASFESEHRGVRLWDLQSFSLLHFFIAPERFGPVTYIKFSPDGYFLACLGRFRFWVWDLETKSFAYSFSGYKSALDKFSFQRASFSYDSKLVASFTYNNFIEIWDIENNEGSNE